MEDRIRQPGESVYEIVQKEFACGHESTEVRMMQIADGRVQFASQCLHCGHNCGFVRRDSLRAPLGQIRNFDEGLRERWKSKESKRRQEIHAQSRAEYEAYLASDEWQAIRQAVMRRDKGLCQGCLKRPAAQVHHLTYDRLGKEMMFDLVAICKDCHEAIHERQEKE